MIKLVKMECPSCGATLEKKLFRNYRCTYCNSQYMLDVDVIVPVPAKPKKSDKKNLNRPRKSAVKKRKQKTNTKAEAWVCAASIVLILIVVLVLTARDNAASDNAPGKNNSVNKGATDVNGIKSTYFKEFVKTVFGKEADQVTADELGEITYFVMHDNKFIVDYKRNDGELKTIALSNETYISYEDFKFFPGIKVLKWEAYKEKNEALKYLPKLEELTCEISPYLVMQYIQNPTQLKKLSCKFYEDGKGIGEIERFENLTDLSLTIRLSAISKEKEPDLSSVAKLTKLQSFYLDNDRYLMVPFLAELPNLRSVNLHCDALKDISFLNTLPELESLTLVKCDILNVDNLKYTPNLKVLRLEDCYQVESYVPVTGLKKLEELMLSYHYGQILPESYENLSNVTRLTLDGFNDISFISDFPNLTFLQMYGCNYYRFDKVACMKDLKEIKLGAGTGLTNISALTGLEKLEKADFSGMKTGADTEQLFMIPNLKELNISATEFNIDLNLIGKNESLETLYMDELNWSAYNTNEGNKKYNYANWQKLPLSECMDFVANFPNLKVLSVQGDKLDNIEFAGSLTKLEKLDITNNYVSDILVLNKLPDLLEVRCGENPIDRNTKLDSRAMVDYTTKAAKRWPFVFYDW